MLLSPKYTANTKISYSRNLEFVKSSIKIQDLTFLCEILDEFKDISAKSPATSLLLPSVPSLAMSKSQTLTHYALPIPVDSH
jgi:hypothetical protein